MRTTTSSGSVTRLKGVNNTAQGNALGIADGPPKALKGRRTGTPRTSPGEGNVDQAGGRFAPSGLRRFGNGIPRALPWAVVSPPFRRASAMCQRWGQCGCRRGRADQQLRAGGRLAPSGLRRFGNGIPRALPWAVVSPPFRRASAMCQRWGQCGCRRGRADQQLQAGFSTTLQVGVRTKP